MIKESVFNAFLDNCNAVYQGITKGHEKELCEYFRDKKEFKDGDVIWVHDGPFGELFCTVKYEKENEEISKIIPDFTLSTM